MKSLGRPGLTLAALAVLAAFLIRAALPMGWMPAQTQDGIRVLLCSGKGAIELALPKSDRGGEQPGQSKDDLPRDPCPFGASLAKAFDLPAPLALPAMPMLAAAVKSPEAVTARIVAARGIRPPARGPPATA